tara:strand:+ start:3465 stop:3773 length:309 start_codon:yes stop_codon:yes gene_type:complete
MPDKKSAITLENVSGQPEIDCLLHIEQIVSDYRDERPDEGMLMKIGVRNRLGSVAIIIRTKGLAAFMYVIESLIALEMIDELEDEESTVDGFDAIFQHGWVQ